jgi:chemotaxis protein methyltransferase CheR
LGIHPPSELLTPRDFEQISDLACRTCGLDLKKGKHHLVQARLAKTIREGRFASFQEYYEHVVADRTGEELIALLDALTTNFTSFLREPSHFEFLRKTILPQLQNPPRIWSAACSTGEEPFTIAFSLLEELGLAASDRTRILATDISTKALATAEQAVYQSQRSEDLPPEWRSRYLLRGSKSQEGWCRVKPHVRGMVEFRRLNLIEPFPLVEKFHVIFCRNVMIYFSKSTQAELVGRLTERLDPGGYLLIGHSESLHGFQHGLQYIEPAVYRKTLPR